MKGKLLILTVIFALQALSVWSAQDDTTQEPNDQTIQKIRELVNQDPDACEELIHSILELDSTDVAPKIRLQALQYLGLIRMYNYRFEESNALFRRAFALSSYLPEREHAILGQLHLDAGRNFNWQSAYDSALSSFFKSKDAFELAEDKNGIAKSYNAIAIITIQYNNDPEKALQYFTSAMKLHQEAGDTTYVARVMQNIGQLYNLLGKNDSAVYFLRQSNNIIAEAQDLRSLAIGNNILGAIFYDMSQLDSSELYYKQAIALDIQNQDSVGLMDDYCRLSKTLLAKQSFSEAERYALLAFNHAKNIYPKIESAETLSNIYEAQQQYRNALSYFKEFKLHTDSVKREDQQAAIDELQTKYETAEKEKEILSANAEIQQKERFQLFLIVLSLVVTISAGTIIYTQRQKNVLKEKALQAELSELRVEIKTLIGKYEGTLDVELDELNVKLVNPLSEREYDVFKQIYSQKTNSEIAEELFVSINTVKTHLKNLYTKLGVSNRKEALNLVLGS